MERYNITIQSYDENSSAKILETFSCLELKNYINNINYIGYLNNANNENY